MHKKAYLFDMDGVLVDNCHAHVRAWLEFARRHGGHLTEREVVDWMGAPASDYMTRMFDQPLTETRIRELTCEKEILYRDLYRPELAPTEGLLDFLAYARATHVPCAISTGGSLDNVDFVLDGLHIRDFFACVIDSSCYEHGKPAPDCYLRAADALHVPPADCCVFEDALNGIAAAQAAGMEVYARIGTNSRNVLVTAHPTGIFTSFREFLPGQLTR